MTVYYVDDGGSNTSPYDTWAKAAPNVKTLDTAIALASGDIVYVGHDSVDATSTTLTIVGPTSGLPVKFVSATQGSDPVAYQAATADQIASTSAAAITLNGSFAFYGILVTNNYSGTVDISLEPDADETFLAVNSTFAPSQGGSLELAGSVPTRYTLQNCVMDLSADGTTGRSGKCIALGYGANIIKGLTFVNSAYRTGTVFTWMNNSGKADISDIDVSGFINGTPCELMAPSAAVTCTAFFRNCKTAATWTPFTAVWPANGSLLRLVNCGSAFAPTYLVERTENADLVSSTGIYRTGGASFESTPTSWLITTQSNCGEDFTYATPWIIGTVTADEHTFDIFITNDTADFTDAEVRIELEYLGTSGGALGVLTSDGRASPTTTAAAQTDDASTWNGTGPSFTYKQKLSVTVTVGQAGQYRARVVVGVASIAGSRYFYVDPKVIVS